MFASILRPTTRSLQSLVMTLAPHGGQATSRQNAWASMSQGAVRARGRAAATVAMDRALVRAAHRTGVVTAAGG